jgi:hypothetical protein
MSDNDDMYEKGILDNFTEDLRIDFMSCIPRDDWEAPDEPKLTYFEEHVLRLLDGIYGKLNSLEARL